MRTPCWTGQAGGSPNPMFSVSAVKNWYFIHLQFIVLPGASLSPQTGKTSKYSFFSLLTGFPCTRSLFSPWLTCLQLRRAGRSATACPTRHLSVFACLPLQESEQEYMLNYKKITHMTTCLGVLMPLCFHREGILFPDYAKSNFLIYPLHTQGPWIILQ